MTNGTIQEVPCAVLGFKAKVNDEIDIYTNNDKIIYSKVSSVNKPERSYNKLVYLLLALIFGATGVHKLYAGDITVGAVWLIIFIILLLLTLFTGILGVISMPAFIFMWVIAVIQGIIGLFKNSDGN